MAVLGLHFCVRAFSSCGKREPLFIAVHGPLTIAASLVAEHRLQTCRLSNCDSRALLLRGMWDLPRPGLEPVSPAFAGKFSTTPPPGKPLVGDVNTPLSPMDRSSKMKINTEAQALNDTLNKMDLIDISRTFHPITTEYTFFSSVHATFSRIVRILGHKSSLGKFKKIEIVSRIFSEHNAMRLDINYRKRSVKNTNTWRLHNALLNNGVITEEIKGEI